MEKVGEAMVAGGEGLKAASQRREGQGLAGEGQEEGSAAGQQIGDKEQLGKQKQQKSGADGEEGEGGRQGKPAEQYGGSSTAGKANVEAPAPRSKL